MLCPQKCCPGRGVPTKLNGWTTTAGSEWLAYSEHILTGKEIAFDYVPLNVPPFFQYTNYFAPGKTQKIFPLPMLSDFNVKFQFHEKLNSIFKPVGTGNEEIYRFKFTKIELHVEKLRLSKQFHAELMRKRSTMTYQGLTRVLRYETIQPEETIFRTKIQNVAMPDGMFIFAVPKTAPSGAATYAKNTSGNVFDAHNITKIDLAFDYQSFFLKEPHIGNFGIDVIQRKAYFDAMNLPPFGVKWDESKHNLATTFGVGTPYPHCWLNFCHPDKSKIVPVNFEASILNKPHDLDVVLTFGTNGATADVMYLIYLYYTDNNLVFDAKNRAFYSPYLRDFPKH